VITVAAGAEGVTQVGGLVGHNSGAGVEIKYCYAQGEVHGTSSVGGLIGWVIDSCVVSDCWSSVKVVIDVDGIIPGRETGGFIGAAYTSTLTRCFALGPYEKTVPDESLDEETGGFVGFNGSSTNGGGNFWNSETVGLEHDTQSPSSTPLGVKKNTYQLQQQGTFSQPYYIWSYDFDNDWTIVEAQSYPTIGKVALIETKLPLTGTIETTDLIGTSEVIEITGTVDVC